jgi:hypothetical protein
MKKRKAASGAWGEKTVVGATHTQRPADVPPHQAWRSSSSSSSVDAAGAAAATNDLLARREKKRFLVRFFHITLPPPLLVHRSQRAAYL